VYNVRASRTSNFRQWPSWARGVVGLRLVLLAHRDERRLTSSSIAQNGAGQFDIICRRRDGAWCAAVAASRIVRRARSSASTQPAGGGKNGGKGEGSAWRPDLTGDGQPASSREHPIPRIIRLWVVGLLVIATPERFEVHTSAASSCTGGPSFVGPRPGSWRSVGGHFEPQHFASRWIATLTGPPPCTRVGEAAATPARAAPPGTTGSSGTTGTGRAPRARRAPTGTRPGRRAASGNDGRPRVPPDTAGPRRATAATSRPTPGTNGQPPGKTGKKRRARRAKSRGHDVHRGHGRRQTSPTDSCAPGANRKSSRLHDFEKVTSFSRRSTVNVLRRLSFRMGETAADVARAFPVLHGPPLLVVEERGLQARPAGVPARTPEGVAHPVGRRHHQGGGLATAPGPVGRRTPYGQLPGQPEGCCPPRGGGSLASMTESGPAGRGSTTNTAQYYAGRG
jgi:hypothetical protein